MRARAAQVEQRGKHVLLHGGERFYGRSYRLFTGDGGQFVAQFHHHALGGFLAHAGDAHQPLHLAAADGIHQVHRGHAGKHLHRQGRADAADADQFFEQGFLVLREKSVERQRIFAHVSVDSQPHLGAGFRQMGVGGNGDGNVVSHASSFHHSLVRMFFEQKSAQ